MRKLLRKKPYVKEGHLYFGRGAVAKPKFDNGKIYLGGGLKKGTEEEVGVIGENREVGDWRK